MEKIPKALLFLKDLIASETLKEIDLLMKDQVSSWRCSNLLNILEKSKGKKALGIQGQVVLNPKLLVQITESGSLEDNEDIQDMWAGLLATANNDENILFVEILKGLSPFQCRVLKYAVENIASVYDRDGLIFPAETNQVQISTDELLGIYGYPSNVATVDRELDSLREKGLIVQGYSSHDSAVANITPTPLVLHLIMRCDGNVDGSEYYGSKLTKLQKPNGDSESGANVPVVLSLG